MRLWEKGKLFGLLNIVDIIVILLVVAAVVGVAAKTSVLGGWLLNPRSPRQDRGLH